MKKLSLFFLAVVAIVVSVSPLSVPMTHAAQQTLNAYGKFPSNLPDTLSRTSFSLTANDSAIAWIMQTPYATTTRKVGFYITSFTASSTVTVAIETVSSTTGFPSGTLWGANTSATTTVNAQAWFEVTLNADATFAAGDIFAVTVRSPSSGAGNITIGRAIGGAFNPVFPYTATNGSTTWTKNSGGVPAVYLEDSNGVAVKNLSNFPVGLVSNPSINTGTTPDEVGLVFQFNNPVKLHAVAITHRLLLASTTLTLYDASNTVLASSTWNLNVAFSTQGSPVVWVLPAPITLTANSKYRATVQSLGSNIVPTYYGFTTQTVMRTFEWADTFQLTTRTDGGSWTDSTTSTMGAYVVVSATDDGGGIGALDSHKGDSIATGVGSPGWWKASANWVNKQLQKAMPYAFAVNKK